MVTVARLRRKPRHFQAFTGLSPIEFDQLLAELTPAYQSARQQCGQRPERQRQAGAGHPFALALPERLLMGLMYLRLYAGQSLLSFLFGIDQSNVCRELSQRLLPVLLTVLPTPLRDAPLRGEEPPSLPPTSSAPAAKGKRRRINTLDELLRTYPDLKEVLIDATEQSVPQPGDKHQRKLAYSGKQQILHVFGGLPGCLNDQLLLGASGVLHQVPADVPVRIDKGYDGTDRRYPHLSIQQPVKKRRGHQVTVLGGAFNHLLSVLRMPVEHHFARLQTFRVLAGIFRGRQEAHEDIFCIVAGLLNFRQTGRFCLG
jgi:hypothetical protein